MIKSQVALSQNTCLNSYATASPATAQVVGSFSSFTGYYCILTTTAGHSYTFSSSLATGAFNVRTTSASGTVIATGANGSVNFIAPGTSVYVNMSTAACATGTNATSRTMTYTDITPSSTSSVPLSQGFNSTTIPTNWFQVDNGSTAGSTNPTLTFVASSSNPTTAPEEGSDFVNFNSFNSPSASTARLISAPISTSGTSSVAISYYWYLDNNSTYASNNDNVQVQYSTDGFTWVNIGSAAPRNGTPTGWTLESVNSSAIANLSKVYIGFLFTSAFGDNCSLDNVNITGLTNCTTPLTPNSLVAGPTTSTSIPGTIGVPGTVPTGYLVISTTSSTLSAAPANGTAYAVGASLGGGIVQYVNTTNTFTAATSLSSNTQYYLFAFSYNSACTGQPFYSSTSGFTNSTTVPSAPTIGTATAGNTSVAVTFTAPGGSATITSYTVTSSPGSFTSTGLSSPITVSGLTNGTAYTFTVIATNAGGTSAASAASNPVIPNPACISPSAPTGLSLVATTSTTITGSFTAPSPAPSNYLVIRTTTSTAPTTPSNGTTYTAGATALGGYIVSTNTTPGFTDNTVVAATQYWYWVYSYNNTACSGGPLYSATNINGTVSTTSQKNWIGYGTAGATATQTDFNAAANWNTGISPVAGDNLVMNINAAVSPAIIMSANNITVNSLSVTTTQSGGTAAVKSFSLSTNGNNFTVSNSLIFNSSATGAGGHSSTFNVSGGTTTIGSLSTSASQTGAGAYGLTFLIASGATLTDNGNFTVSEPSGGGTGTYISFFSNSGTFTINGTTLINSTSTTGSQVQLGVASGATTTFAGTATFDDGSSSSTDAVFLKSTAGITTGKFVFKNNLNFGLAAATSSSNIPGTYVFDGNGTQIITNNSASLTTLSSIQIGNTNSPMVSFAGSTTALTLNSSNIAGVVSTLAINNNSVLDLGTFLLNRGTGTNATGGFAINNTGTLKLGNVTGGQTGSNFPSGFSFSGLVAGSTVEYYAAGTPTIYAVASPGYGNLTIGDITSTPATIGTATAALTVAGNMLINPNAKFAAGTNLTHNIAGNWTNNGAFSFTTGSTINFNTAGSTLISGSGVTAFQNIILNKGTDGTNVLEANGTGALSNTGTITVTNGLFKMTTGTWAYGTGTVPATGGVQVNGAALTSGSFINNGLVRITSGAATFGTAAGSELTNQNNALFDFQGGTVSFTGRFNNTANASGTPPTWYTPYGVSISGGVLTVATLGNTSATVGSFNMGSSSNVFVTGGTIVVQTPSTATTPFNDINILNTTGTKSLTAGTFQIGNSGTTASKVFLINSAVPIGSLLVNATNAPTGRLAAGLTVNNNISINGGTLDAATTNSNISIGGNWSSAGTFSPGTDTVTFNSASGTQTVNNNTSSFANLSHGGAATLQVVTNSLNATGAFTNSAGTYDPATNGLATTITGLTSVSGGIYLAGSATQTLSGGLTLSGGVFTGSTGAVSTSNVTLGTGTLTAPSGLFTVSGNWVSSSSGVTFNPGTYTLTFNGTAAQQSFTSGNLPFYNIDHAGIKPLRLATNDLTINGFFTNEAGTGNFNPGNQNVTIKGLTTVLDGIYNAANATISTTQTLTGGLTLSNVNGVYAASTVGGTTTVGNVLAVSGGTFSGSTGTVNAATVNLNSGIFNSTSGVFSVSGNFTDNGIFADNNGTVVINGTSSQTITNAAGGTTFYNFTLNNPAGAILFDTTMVDSNFVLTNGILTTTTTNLLVITNSVPTVMQGGSATSFINGPVKWTLPNLSSSPNIYRFPVGAGTTYLPFSATAITSTSLPSLYVQAFTGNTGGSGDGTTLATSGALSTTEYWKSLTAKGTISSLSVSLARQTPVSPYNVIAENGVLTGPYKSFGGTPSGDSINNSSAIGNTATRYYVMGETPTITISSAISPTSATACFGSASSNMILSVSGGALIGGITATAPSGFEVSLSATTSFGPSITISGSGTIASTTVYVRLKSSDAAGTYSGNIVLSSTGATSVNVAIASSTVNATTSITTQPTGATYCQNATATALSVSGAGASPAYQWYSNTVNNNTSGTVISGATGSSYTPLTTTAGTTYYYVTITGTCGVLTSNTASIIINPATSIITNPTGSMYCQNVTATALSVTATGTGTLTYQWYSNATNSNTGGTSLGSGSGAQTASYTPSTVTAGTKYYYAVVTGSCGTATSTTATVIVNATTVISSQPSGATYCQNATPTTLSVTATGTSVNYQWYSNTTNSNTGGTLISGATSSTYVQSTTTAGTVYYYVIVSGICGTVTSTTAAVIVNAATVITANPLSTQTCCQNATATALSVTATGTIVSYQWYSNATNSNTGGTLISGATSSTYILSTTTAGTVYYYVIVSGTCGIATSTTAAVIVNASTIITGNPLSTQLVCQTATPTTLSVTATGTSLTYQWYSNTVNDNITGTLISGAISSTYIPSTTVAGTIYYYAIVSGTCGTATSTTAAVIVNATTVLSSQPAGATYCQNSTATALSVTATGTSLSYQWYSNSTNSNTGGSLISGATSSSYTPSTTTSGTVYYYVIVSGTCGTATSSSATVTVTTPPSATISYAGSPYCSSGGTAIVTMTGTTGGTYSSTTGLVIDGTSGDVNLGTSTAGTFTVTYTVAASGGCSIYTTTKSITITAISFATISYNGGAPYCPGTTGNGMVTRSGTAGGTYSASPSGLVIDANTGTIDLTTSTSGSYTVTYTVTASGGCSTYMTSTTVVIGPDTWTGAADGDWNNVNNWSCYFVPTINNDVVIPALMSGTYPSVYQSPKATARNITIAAGASITVTTDTLQISGTISNAGIFNATVGTLEFNGTSAQTIPGNTFTSNNTIRNLIISNNVSVGDSLNITGVLSFGATGKTLSTGDKLILRSGSSLTASVGVIDPSNHIVGAVIVERYIATGTGPDPNDHPKTWQLLAVPTTGETLNQAWMEGATASNVTDHTSAGNPHPGYGTMVTSDNITALADGFDAYTKPGSTVKAYNYSNDTYAGLPNTGTQLYDKRGYFVFARGDRSVYAYNQTADHAILRTKGTLFTPDNAPTSSTVHMNKFESIGNPYASPVDMTKVSATGGLVNQYIYVWDPRLGGSYNYGAFVTLQLDGTGNYEVQAPATSPTYGIAGTISNYIQSGQAFFMQATGADGTVSFSESSKAAGVNIAKLFTREGNGGLTTLSTAGARPTGQQQATSLRTTLYAAKADGTAGSPVDGILNQFDDSYNNEVDGYDARKAINTGENLSVRTGGKLLVIEKKHTIVSGDTIFLNLTGLRAQGYQFSLDATNLSRTIESGYVEDAYTSTRTPLNLKGNTQVNFTVVNVAGSYAPDRFRIVFSPLKVLPVTFASIKAYRQDRNINVEWRVNNERNIKEYGVEKSADGKAFTTMATSKPSNNNGGTAGYVIADIKPITGDNYYRIWSVDVNDAISYSTIVKVMIGKEQSDINIYPNPITDGQIHLQFENEGAGRYGIRLLNKAGQMITQKQVNREEGNSTELIKWDFALAHGMYQLEVTKPDGSVKSLNVIY